MIVCNRTISTQKHFVKEGLNMVLERRSSARKYNKKWQCRATQHCSKPFESYSVWSLWLSQTRWLSSNYVDNITHVSMVEVFKNGLHPYDHLNSLLGKHPVSLYGCKIISGTSYRRNRTMDLNTFKQKTLSLQPGCHLLNSLIKGIHKNKPRCLKDNFKAIREV